MASKLINIDEFEGKNEDFVAFRRYFRSQNVTQIDALSKKVSQRLGVLRRVKYLLPLHGRLAIYNSLISRFPKVEQHPKCMDHAILHEKTIW
jgi:hypothetical protein